MKIYILISLFVAIIIGTYFVYIYYWSSDNIIFEAIKGKNFVKSLDLKGSKKFDLNISNNLLVDGKQDNMGMGMAIILDAILARGFVPDGFTQQDGFRVYHYKMNSE